MSRLSKFLLLFVLIIFVIACNFVPQQVKDVQNLASTAESVASSMPGLASTAKSVLTSMPDITTTLESAATSMPDFGEFNYFNPQGTPLSEWNEVPIMPQATAGQEFNDGTYSFKVNATAQEVQDYYNSELVNRGWSSMFNLPGDENGAIMLFSKEDGLLTVTVTSLDGETVVVLTL